VVSGELSEDSWDCSFRFAQLRQVVRQWKHM
jgi:hypothetical protein